MTDKKGGGDPLKLGERDLDVLSALESWGILGLGQIDGLVFKRELNRAERIKLFFNETDSSVYVGYAYKRLLKLERAGLIKGISFVNFPKLYCLSLRGHETLGRRGLARLPSFRRSISASLVRHELMVNGVGLTMREILGLDVRTEMDRISRHMGSQNLARQRRLILSDLWVVNPEQPKAIEVELRQKSWERYRKLWEVYDRHIPYKGVVLYLAGWPGGRDRLHRFARRFKAHRIHAGSLADFRADPETCPFVGPGTGQILTLSREFSGSRG